MKKFKSVIYFRFNGQEYLAEKGTKTINNINGQFITTTDKNINDFEYLEYKVIEHLAINNLNDLVVEILENKGIDDKLQKDIYDFIENIELNQILNIRELYILADLEDIELFEYEYQDSYLKFYSGRSFFITDLKGKLLA